MSYSKQDGKQGVNIASTFFDNSRKRNFWPPNELKQLRSKIDRSHTIPLIDHSTFWVRFGRYFYETHTLDKRNFLIKFFKSGIKNQEFKTHTI